MEAALVLALVFSPVDLTACVPHQAGERWWEALKAVSWACELAGPSARWLPNFRDEVRWTRRYVWQDRSCPSIGDCDRLPDWSVCREYYARWRYVGEKVERARWERLHWADRLAPLLEACNRGQEFWSLAAQAQDQSLLWISRRQRLDELRTLLGREAYQEGDWPTPERVLGP